MTDSSPTELEARVRAVEERHFTLMQTLVGGAFAVVASLLGIIGVLIAAIIAILTYS